jgi:hypothetical protein
LRPIQIFPSKNTMTDSVTTAAASVPLLVLSGF